MAEKNIAQWYWIDRGFIRAEIHSFTAKNADFVFGGENHFV